LDHMTAVQLKALCKERGLKVSGKKAHLKERIREHFLSDVGSNKKEDDGLDSMSDDDLRDFCVARGLGRKGARDELLERLRSDIDFTSGIMKSSPPCDRDDYIALSEALEAASQEDGSTLSEILAEVKERATAEPKHIEVTIKSIGLDPIKFTAGGAPSVTADVLRTLAGDPFADPPKYGTVRARNG